MRKVKEITIPEQVIPAHTETVIEVTCDDCGVVAPIKDAVGTWRQIGYSSAEIGSTASPENTVVVDLCPECSLKRNIHPKLVVRNMGEMRRQEYGDDRNHA